MFAVVALSRCVVYCNGESHHESIVATLEARCFSRIIGAMDHSLQFRKALALRVAGALGISFAVVGTGPGCGAKVVVDGPTGGAGGAGGVGGVGGFGSEGGNGLGGTGNAGANGGFGGTLMTTVTATSASSSGNSMCDMPIGSPTDFLACIQPDSTGSCPAQKNAFGPISQTLDGCTCLRSVESEPSPDPSGGSLCCYKTLVEFVCVVGRALPSENGPIVAPFDNAKRGWCEEELLPCVDGLSATEREIIAQRWIRDGLFEHASIASFSRLALALLATSADADLVRAAHEAALDEVRHAKRSLSLAAAYRGEPVSPRALPLPDVLPLGADLVELAVASVVEGAVGETLAAVLAAEQAAVAEDPAVRRVLLGIADDESRHAELAYRVIAFAIAAGGQPVREAVSRAFAEASSRLPAPAEDVALPANVARAHGFVASSVMRAAFVRAMDDIVLPLGGALCRTAVGVA